MSTFKYDLFSTPLCMSDHSVFFSCSLNDPPKNPGNKVQVLSATSCRVVNAFPACYCSAMSSAVLCCAVLFCAVLCCAVLCCAVLCCAVLCCAVLCPLQVEHHKKVICLVCNSVVTPYEAYHIDAGEAPGPQQHTLFGKHLNCSNSSCCCAAPAHNYSLVTSSGTHHMRYHWNLEHCCAC
jgi:hypothetical protein